MRTDRAGRLFDELLFPPRVHILCFVPTPLSGNITERGKFGYGCMEALGPNDGLVLI
jgi:hypothetical protein